MPAIEWMWTSTIGLSPEMPKRQIWRRSMSAAVAHRARRGVGAGWCVQVLQRDVLRRVDAQVAQAHLRQRGGHARRALDVHRLQVAVDAAASALPRSSSAAVAKVTRAVRAGRDRQAHAQAGDRVQPVDRRAVGRRRLRDRAAGVASVRLRPRRRAGRSCSRPTAPARRPRPRNAPRATTGSPCRRGLRASSSARQPGSQRLSTKRLAKAGCASSALRVGEHGLEVRDQLQRAACVAAGVVQRDRAQLGVVLGADQTVVRACRPGQLASNCTWSARKRAR